MGAGEDAASSRSGQETPGPKCGFCNDSGKHGFSDCVWCKKATTKEAEDDDKSITSTEARVAVTPDRRSQYGAAGDVEITPQKAASGSIKGFLSSMRWGKARRR